MSAGAGRFNACSQLGFEEPFPLRAANLRQIQTFSGNFKGKQETGCRQLDIDQAGITQQRRKFIYAKHVTFVTRDFTRQIT